MSLHHRQIQQQLHQQQLLQQQHQQQMAENDAAALAAEIFDHFCVATTMRQVLGLYRNMCDTIGLRPAPLNEFYPKLKEKIRNWKAQALWKKFDTRAAHRVYNKGNACPGTRVLVIGAGPCGLRTAIEAQLLGAKVVVVEKRDRISRNNVLHLWPFVITDLRNLGAKKFYGKFCAGSIDHISIRQLQCILLKVALLLGVEVHEGVSFISTIEPSDGYGWRAQVSPEDHAVSHYEFDVLIGADGKRNTLEAFKRKEFRGKLAIAITANFINKKTEAEAKAEEISGVAFIFNQSFFKELYQTTGIDLENIVYYKDETHYFVMTAKKHSLIDKGVIIQDFADPAELLASQNVNTDKLLDYAREAAEFSTKYQMPNLEFAVNHYGKPDVAMFDFTSMFAAETSCRVLVRKNYRLLQCLVGDSLLEPFWPTGSGCARGFLSSMDSAYAIKLWSNSRNSILGVLAQRESIYRLLAQTTPENLQRDIGAYTVDPGTRYPNLNKSTVNVWQVKHLIDTDDPAVLEQTFMDTNVIQASGPETPIRRKRRTGDTLPLSTVLLRWIKAQLHSLEFSEELAEVSECFTSGKVLCALINRYRPDLIDLNILKDCTPRESNELAFKILETELGIPRVMSSKDSVNLENVESKIWLNYLEQVCEVFRGEIPHVKHPKLDFAEFKEGKNTNNVPDFSKLLKLSSKKKSPLQDIDVTNIVHRKSVLDEDKVRRQRKYGADSNQPQLDTTTRRAKKRRSHEKSGNVEERQQRLQEIEMNRLDRQSKRRLHRFQQTQNFYKSLHMLQANTLLRESDSSSPFEDYSIYMYRQQAPEFNDRVKDLERKLLYPDRERGIQSSMPRGAADEQFSDRIKNMEQRITSRNASGNDKKPKDLLRAIGKIESTDWNIREIEKKIEQSKKTEIGKSREKVPKWTKEQFIARQNKMSKPIERQESTEEKFKDIDQTLKNLDKQLKEGSILEIGQRGKNKVASIAGQFVKKDDTSEEKNVSTQKSSSKVGLVFNKQAASEKCHFCKQTVYLMEKISTEGLILHRSCLKCYHCHTNLRLGGYAFDRDDPVGRFYCTQHFRLPAKPSRPMVRKSTKQQKKDANDQNKITGDDLKTPVRGRPDNVAQLDLLDRGQTPERIEFENVDAMSDGEPSLEHIIDENEWTDRNFITGSEDSESDLSSSDSSDEESDSDMFEEANGSPIGAQTLQLATDWIGKQRYSNMDDSDEDFYDSSDGLMDDDADSQTEGEEFKKAREMRRQEVKLLPPPANLPTDTETEVQTDSESSSPELNSATEISTDSEFEHDPIIHEAPRIFIDDTHLRKPTKVQIKQGVIMNSPSHRFSTTINKKQHNTTIKHQTPVKPQKPQIELEFKPLVQVDPSLLITNRQPLKNPNPGDYMLNKTASTEGIASRKSLELKKRYLLGEQGIGNGIMKSGSTSILDTKFKSFHSNISECQKLLNPSTDITASMKTFLDRTKILENNLINNKNDLKNSDNEKENRFVNNQNDINKGMEYSETINATLVETITKNLITPPEKQTTPTPIIETIDLISPEKQIVPIIDLTIQIDTTPPSKLITTKNHEFLNNNIVDLTFDNTPIKTETKNLIDKPDISKDIKETIPDIINQIDDIKHDNNKSTDTTESIVKNQQSNNNDNDDEIALINKDNNDIQDTCIQVPNIPWNLKTKNHPLESDSLSNSSTSSLEEIPHYILDSTTSPDTQNGLEQIVPRLEIHDSSGTLMQIDSLMIIDGKYVGDPEDLKHMAIPEGTRVDTIPEKPELDENLIKTNNKRPDLKFDTKNENKIDSLKNLPLIIDKDDKKKLMKPQSLDLEITKQHQQLESPNDKDKTPTAETNIIVSDSETEMTGQVLTETELSDWTADDAVSENFVDLEFVLNSNKGTIKRNKKDKKKLQSPKTINMKTNSNNDKKILETASSKQQCGILKNLDIEEIEFMDTGSEGSCAEAYSATNKTMLQNRGYIQFIDNHTSEIDNRQTIKSYDRYENDCKQQQQQKRQQEQKEQQDSYQNNIESSSMAKEIPGIDYIEQGACILNNDIDLKTPVNEISPPIFPTKLLSQQIDNLNDIDDDSLVLITSQGTTTGTTTEESDALTVVTSPLDSSPFNHDNNVITPTPTPTPMTTIIFDRMDKQNSIPNSKIPIRKSSIENKRLSQEDLLLTKRKDSDELSYEEYVRKLQLKITQISNARDSIDIRKQKRKSSKGDISDCCTQNNSVIENNINKSLSIFEPTTSSVIQKTIETQQSYVDEPEETEEHIELPTPTPTVSSKLEELTKERTKQKDLIHDLVMDKLQSKKQLNAEKRLNRSRNRSLFNANGGLMTSPKITQQTTSINDNGDCTNSPHYHAKSSENYNKSNDNQQQQYHRKLSPKDNKDIVQMFTKSLSATTTPLTTTPLTTTPTAAGRLKQRPLSDNLDMIQPIKSTIFDQEQQPQQKYGSKITKTQSFCVYTTPMISSKSSKLEDSSILSTNTDKLRAEARARARLKSNHDLGLSPEEKLRLLRKRYNLDMNDIIGGSSEITTNPNGNSSSSHNNQSDDMKVRDRKMITSKSVNDITTVQNLLNSDENFDTNDSMKMNKIDFTSDPNLTNSQETSGTGTGTQKVRRSASARKDPERRKSIIKTVSDFFHKKKDKDSTTQSTATASTTPTKEKADGVFSRFKISPKSKEKSKEKDGSPCYDQNKSQDYPKYQISSYSSSPQLFKRSEEVAPPPIPPLPLNYQRSDDESYTNESREQKKQRAISKASRQAELKRLRIAQEIQREQEEIEVKLKELEARGVLIEKALRGEGQNMENLETSSMGASDEKLLKELLEIWGNITQLKKRDEELGIRQQELQLEHRHAQLKEELNMRLSFSKLDKSSADVAAEGAILNEMLEIVAKRAALRPNETTSTTIGRQLIENDSED